MALDHIDPKNERDYHISFDIDALDRHDAPSTGISRKFFLLNFQLFSMFFDPPLFHIFQNSSRWFDAA